MDKLKALEKRIETLESKSKKEDIAKMEAKEFCEFISKTLKESREEKGHGFGLYLNAINSQNAKRTSITTLNDGNFFGRIKDYSFLAALSNPERMQIMELITRNEVVEHRLTKVKELNKISKGGKLYNDLDWLEKSKLIEKKGSEIGVTIWGQLLIISIIGSIRLYEQKVPSSKNK